MNDLDLFWINDGNGHEVQMEAVAIYSMAVTGYNYIIYRDLDKTNCYVAKFKDDDIENIITDLDDKEYSYANIVLKEVI